MHRYPLLVHFVFHPDSKDALKLARTLHDALNDDVAVPGLRIPTLFCATDGGNPPTNQPLDDADRSCVVVLADDHLAADDDWCRFVVDLRRECDKKGSAHRLLPFQLTADAWPLHPKLEDLSFARAYLRIGSDQNEFVARRLVTSLCRYLHDDSLGDEQSPAPTCLFISHTKMDMTAKPRVVNALVRYLQADKPVAAWVDSGQIDAGSRFADKIEQGVEDSSLLCVMTDNWGTRRWCREEMLLAKTNQRPIVVIDALQEREVRSFPYVGNVPVVRWTGDAGFAVDLLLKETLRTLHTQAALKQSKKGGDEIFVRAPELATLVGLGKKTVLYPDPPVGVEETRLLEKTGVTITTPLTRMTKERPLKGKTVALSMSEATDIARYGLDDVHQTSAMLELSRYLLIKGATLAYGGHLGSEGYTEKLFELVRAHNALDGVEPVKRILNYLGWPLHPNVRDKARFKFTATLKTINRPKGINERLSEDFKAAPDFFPADRSPLHRYAWARGMTRMREIETGETCARVVLGGVFGPTVGITPDGKRIEKWYQGRIPGVFEELVISLRAGQPVFLIGAFGGVAALVVDLLEGRDRREATWDFQKRAPHAEAMRDRYSERGDEWLDYPEMVDLIRSKGIRGLNPLLSKKDNQILFRTRNVMQMIELLLKGLGRLK